MDDPLDLDEFVDFPKGGDLPAELVKMLGDSRDFDNHHFGLLDDLAISINNYKIIRNEKEIRIKDLIEAAKLVERGARELSKNIDALKELLFDATSETCAVVSSPGWEMELGPHAKIEDDIKSYAKAIADLQTEIRSTYGDDRGGPRGVVSSKVGNPKERLVNDLAIYWVEFRGWPKATVDGDFYRFVCAVHEFATDEEDCNFERAIKKVVPEFVTRVKRLHIVRKRIDDL